MKSDIVKFLLGVAIAVTFILSAIFKFQSIEDFELYLYAPRWFSFHFTTLIARAIVIVEFIAGGLLILGVAHRLVCSVMLAMLVIFSGYLSLLLFTDNVTNCHCFGNMIEFSPIQSIVKNILLSVFLILIVIKEPSIQFPQRKVFVWGVIVIPLIFTLIVNQPDYTSMLLYGEHITYNEEVYETSLKNGTLDKSLKEGKHILMFSSFSFKYCFYGLRKLYLMTRRTDLESQIRVVFAGEDQAIGNFFKKADVPELPYTTIPPKTLLQITNSNVPLFFFIDTGKIVKVVTYSSLTESAISNFYATETPN